MEERFEIPATGSVTSIVLSRKFCVDKVEGADRVIGVPGNGNVLVVLHELARVVG